MDRVLVAFDGSAQAVAALEYAFETFPDVEITVLYVVDPTTDPRKLLSYRKMRSWLIDARKEAGELEAEVGVLSEENGVPVEVDVVYGSTARELLEYCERHDVGQVIAGSHSRSAPVELVFGSVAERLVRRAPVPVTIVRTGAGRSVSTPPTSVLVPVDGSQPAEAALAYACTTFPGASITVLHARDPVTSYVDDIDADSRAWESDDERAAHLEEMAGNAANWERTVQERSEELLRDVAELAAEFGVDVDTVSMSGYPDDEIVEFVETNPVDHVCLGNHGRSAPERFLLGSIAESTLRRSPVPVTVVRASFDA